jgi:hypothetical protein
MSCQRGKTIVVSFLLPMIYDLSIAHDTTQSNLRYVIVKGAPIPSLFLGRIEKDLGMYKNWKIFREAVGKKIDKIS